MRLRHEDDRELEALRAVHRHQLHRIGAVERGRPLARVEVVATLLEVGDHLGERVPGQGAHDAQQLADVRAGLFAAGERRPRRLEGAALERQLEQRVGRQGGGGPSQLGQCFRSVRTVSAILAGDLLGADRRAPPVAASPRSRSASRVSSARAKKGERSTPLSASSSCGSASQRSRLMQSSTSCRVKKPVPLGVAAATPCVSRACWKTCTLLKRRSRIAMSPGRAGRIRSSRRSQTSRPSSSSPRISPATASASTRRRSWSDDRAAVGRGVPDLRQREVGAVARRVAGAARHRRQRREVQRRPGEDLAEELVDASDQCVVAAERAAERQQRPASRVHELLQRGEAVHVRPAEAVDRLPRVADEEERGPRPGAVSACDQLDQLRLHGVDVLRLVDHEVAEALAHLGGHGRVVAQQGDGAQLEIEVVERALRLLRRLVAPHRVLEEVAQSGEHLEGWAVVLVPGGAAAEPRR